MRYDKCKIIIIIRKKFKTGFLCIIIFFALELKKRDVNKYIFLYKLNRQIYKAT